ncbi:MAG: glycosyl hydrolase, partial [Saprospiraceae bacterium]|nr:glycosyl hydrolase [Saprospiraceae bacterium]
MKDPRRSRELFSIFFSLMLCKLIIGQTPASTTAIDRERGYQQRLALQSQSLVANLDIRNVGPSVFSGRVVDLEVSPADPSIFYVAYASGGLWKTINNGTSFTPLFDQEMVMTIGDIAVDWKNNIIWVGTGENNASRSSYAGFGMYRSSDEGITWEQKGLKDSHHTGRIILHPNDPKILWVAMSGHLYSDNPERGIFKSTDGGDTWHKTLYLSEGTGAIELLSDPSNPYILYAALWERSRKAWDFQEAGTGSGLYKSVDGGDTWNKISGGESGFPDGVGVGRIGLTMTRQNGKSYLYALLDNYFRRPAAEDDKSRDLTKNDLRNMSRDDFLALNDKELKRFLRQNRFPRKYNVQLIKSMVAENTIEPQALVEYLEDANNLLFDTPIVGAEVYLSTDDGLTWTRTHEDNIDRFYNTYGYYFGQIRVAPQDPNKLYILGVPILRSIDAGKTWKSINRDNVHVDHHALWVNPDRPGHLILGNDGGVNISYDDGSTWSKNNAPAVGQFYAIAIDKDEPYHVYGGTQDNGVWEGPSTYKQGVAWQSSG